MGHRVMVISASFSHLFNAPPQETEVWHEDVVEEVRYVSLRTPRYDDNSVKRTLNMAVFLLRLYSQAGRIATGFAPDIVIAGSVYLFDSIPAVRITRKSGAALIREVRDLWPLTLIELGLAKRHSPMVAALQLAENYAMRTADFVVSTLPSAYLHFREHGLKEGRFACIPQGIDVTEVTPRSSTIPETHREAIAEFRRGWPFIVGYAGSIVNGDTAEILLQAAELMKADCIGVLIVGDGCKRQEYEEMAQRMTLRNVLFLPRVSREACAAILSQLDCHYMGWTPSPLYRFGVSPNRLMAYMLSGKPVIHAIKYGNDEVAESQCGISVGCGDPFAIADAARRLKGMSLEERVKMGQRGLAHVREKHDYRVLAQAYLQVMGQVRHAGHRS
jgi:glycosyltransferase involved in cell wall biosynthesis